MYKRLLSEDFMKKLITFILTFVIICLPLSACKKDKDNKNIIELNEVTHSVFYAPLYVAMEEGYFADEGIEISLTNGGGADKVMTAVVSKNAHIGLMGPETVVYVHNQGKADAPKVFAQLTQKDGAFLVSRTNEQNFTFENLRNKDILAGREGGMPAMSFEYALYEQGMLRNRDYTFNFGVQFNLMTAAFEGGTSDYVTMFEPGASVFEKAGKGYVVASMGEFSGEIPYTSFIALDSYLDENEDTVKGFLRALKKGLDFILSHTDTEVANSLKGQFSTDSIENLATSIANYRAIDAWKTDLKPTEQLFDRMQDIMIFAGELNQKVAYNKLVNLKYVDSI